MKYAVGESGDEMVKRRIMDLNPRLRFQDGKGLPTPSRNSMRKIFISYTGGRLLERNEPRT
jgi:hypothetical protein